MAVPETCGQYHAVEDKDLIYHLALEDEWRTALSGADPYRRSTLGKSLEDEGFIHCSFGPQVQTIADLVYRGRRDVVLLTIDPARVPAEIRIESLEGGDEGFPHIYGPLPTEAVVAVATLTPDADGRLVSPVSPGGRER
jgi:uncharacterized protein (DUF952 family)